MQNTIPEIQDLQEKAIVDQFARLRAMLKKADQVLNVKERESMYCEIRAVFTSVC